MFSLTMNRAKLSPDLRRRSIAINLEFPGNVREREFSIAQLEDFVLAHRGDLQAEIVGLVSRWIDDGCPMPERPARHSMSQTWAATVDAILRAAGFIGFLENLESSEHRFDTDHEDIAEICTVCHDESPATPTIWAKRLSEKDLCGDKLLDANGFAKSERSQATIVGTLFAKFAGMTFDVSVGRFRLACTSKGKSHDSLAYWFERVHDDGAPSCSVDEMNRGTLEPREPTS
jgi:hypothetical protein